MGFIDFLNRFQKPETIDPAKMPDKESASTEQAYSVPNSNRSLWGGGLVRGLSPAKLASILDAVRNGDDPSEYLEIAQELEQRDAHYRSVLSTRKHTVEALEQIVIPASDSPEDKKIAEAVQMDILEHPDIMDLNKNTLDALGKGFSVNEPIWDTSGKRWKYKTFKFRDPRWFAYDKYTGVLCLRDIHGAGLTPLEPNRYIIHEPNLLSGMQITSGLSFTALFYWLIKNYDVTSWAAFADRFGYPVRLGKYGKKATKEDINTLKRAVAAIGTDVGAVIPDSMIIDVIESKTTGTNSSVYKDMAEWVDKQLSKLVLGQTASAEGTPGRLGDSNEQAEVRQDIKKADAAQRDQTYNRDLVIPYVNYNFGPRDAYPKIKTIVPETKDAAFIVDAVQKLAPLGLKVKASEMLELLTLTAPGEKDEILEQPAVPLGMAELNHARYIALNAAESSSTENQYKNDFEAKETFAEITEEMYAVLEEAADKTDNYEDFLAELTRLASSWPPDQIARLLASATFKSRVDGEDGFSE